MAFSGVIPTIKVTSNSAINSAVNGVVNNVAQGAVNVALNGLLGQQAAASLGFPAGSQNFIGGLVTPLINAAPQALDQAITSSITNSEALGPAGPLVGGLASNLANNLVGGLTNNLLGGLSDFAGPQGATRYFPGAGDEEDADYGGYNYTPGPVGPDVVFSIKPAQNAANSDALAQMFNDQIGVEGKIPFGEISVLGAGSYLSPQTQGGVLGDSLNNLSSGQGLFSPSPGAGFDLSFSQIPAISSQAFQTGTLDSSSGDLFIDTPVQNLPGFSAFSPTAVTLASPFPEVGTQEYFNVAATAATSLTNADLASKYGFDLGNTSQVGAIYGGGEGWKFTTAPADITWDSAAKVDRVPIFGTNKPPVISGSRGMRDLTLSNALIEGFSMVKSVESKIAKLEALLNYTLTSSYVKVPVYWVTASDKKYGNGNNDGGFFVIKQIKVKEEMRDLAGRSTRAVVDVSFTQVPDYQVDDGRDLASKSVAGAKSFLSNVGDIQSKAIEKGLKEGTLSVVQQDSLTGGGTGGGIGGAKPGSGNSNKPGYRQLASGAWEKATRTRTVNGVSIVEELNPKNGRYISVEEYTKLYGNNPNPLAPAPAPTPTPPQQP